MKSMHKLRKSMMQSPSRETDSRVTGQGTSKFLWNPKIHYSINKSATGPHREPVEYSLHYGTLFL
jgi:hypothetical protein